MSAPKAKCDILPVQHTVHQAGREADGRCGSDPEAPAHAKIVRFLQLPPWLSAAAFVSSPRITILSGSRERLHHAAHCRMFAVFHLDPVLRSAGLKSPVATLRHRPFEARAASPPV